MKKSIIMECPECHARFKDENRSVCPYCGAKLVRVEETFGDKIKNLFKKK